MIFDRFLEVETCRSLVRSETENCVYVSEWRRKNGKIDPTHSCPMNIQVDLPKESAFVTDSSLLLAEKILSKLVRLVGTNIIHRKTIYCERSEQWFWWVFDVNEFLTFDFDFGFFDCLFTILILTSQLRFQIWENGSKIEDKTDILISNLPQICSFPSSLFTLSFSSITVDRPIRSEQSELIWTWKSKAKTRENTGQQRRKYNFCAELFSGTYWQLFQIDDVR